MQNELLGKSLKELCIVDQKKMVKIYIFEILKNFFGDYLRVEFNKIGNEYIEFLQDYDFYYRNSKEFLDVYQYYRIVLEDLSKMGKMLNWDNEMKLFSGYIYLLENGYLSLGHQFCYSTKEKSCFELFGPNVMLGKGDCKHVNSMLRDLLNINDLSSYVISILIDRELVLLNELNFENEAFLKRFFVENNLQLDGNVSLGNGDTNHVAVLFVDNNHSYIMDAMNDTIYYVGNDLGVYQVGCQFNVCYHKLYNECKNYELNQLLRPSSKEILINRLEEYYEVCNHFNEMIDIFEKFYREHKGLYSEVVEKRKVLIKTFNKYHIFERRRKKYR